MRGISGRGAFLAVIVIGALALLGASVAAGTPGTPLPGSRATPPGTAAAGTATPGASPVAGGHVTIKIIDTSFVPGSVTVTVGTTVTWINEDSIPHTATGDHGEFDSSILDQGQSYSYTFTKPRTYDYFCKLHPDMLGRVIVVAPAG